MLQMKRVMAKRLVLIIEQIIILEYLKRFLLTLQFYIFIMAHIAMSHNWQQREQYALHGHCCCCQQRASMKSVCMHAYMQLCITLHTVQCSFSKRYKIRLDASG